MNKPIKRKELEKLIELRMELAHQHHLDTTNRALINNTMFAIDELVGLIDRIRHMIYDQRAIIEDEKRRNCNDPYVEGKEKIILELVRACYMYDIIE